MLDKLIDKRMDFSRRVLMDEVLQVPAGVAPYVQPKYSVEQVKYATDEVILKVTTEKPGILVMSDLYTPDWRAWVDGRETKLFRANYAYRGISVQAGKHVVRFCYLPISYKIGTALTMFGIAVVLIIGGLEIRREK
jgi:uncharacterized membrane protein YfhO